MPEPVAHLAAQEPLPPGGRAFSDALQLAVAPQRVTLLLQVAARSLRTVDAIRLAGRPLPITQNAWTGSDPVIMRIAPDGWLLQSTTQQAGALSQALKRACGRRSFTITDLSDALVTFVVDGPQSAALLSRGCSLDLALATFRTSSCTRTRMADLPVVVRRTGFERFECLVERPAARWFHDWIVDAAEGLGLGPGGSVGP